MSVKGMALFLWSVTRRSVGSGGGTLVWPRHCVGQWVRLKVLRCQGKVLDGLLSRKVECLLIDLSNHHCLPVGFCLTKSRFMFNDLSNDIAKQIGGVVFCTKHVIGNVLDSLICF